MSELTAAAYDSFLSILDEAMELTKGALELAEQRQEAAPTVVLTKVASHVYDKTAAALVRTGVFDMSVSEMSQTLSEAGEAGHLAILEKLASRAAFPLTIPRGLGGELVDRQHPTTPDLSNLPKAHVVWREALDEARNEQG